MEQWICPQCETVNSASQCVVCGMSYEEAQSIYISMAQKSCEDTMPDSVQIINQQIQEQEQTEFDIFIRRKKDGRRIRMLGIASSFWLLIISVCSLFCVFGHYNAYETYADAIIASFRSTENNVQYYLDQARTAMADKDWDKARFFYETKVLNEDDTNMHAWLGILEIDMKKETVNIEELKLCLQNLSLDQAVSGGNTTLISQAVQKILDTNCVQKYRLLSQALSLTDKEKNTINEILDSHQEYIDLFPDNSNIKNLKANAYVKICELIVDHEWHHVDENKEYYTDLLERAIAENEGNESLLELRSAWAYRQVVDLEHKISEALTNNDVDLAEALCEDVKAVDAVSGSGMKTKIERYKAEYTFMSELSGLVNDGKYSEAVEKVRSKPSMMNSKIYWTDGKLVNGASGSQTILLDTNGIYVGILDTRGRRAGKGLQIFIYEKQYKLLEGNWSNNQANGEMTYIFWDSGGTKATLTGNYTDGYQNGTMSVSWYNNRNWVGTYHCNMGTITDATKGDDGKYYYAYAYAADGATAWWSTDNLDGYCNRIVE